MKTMGKIISNILIALCCAFLLWLFVSWVDVNMHNGLNPDGTPQGGTQWKYNAFVVMLEDSEWGATPED